MTIDIFHILLVLIVIISWVIIIGYVIYKLVFGEKKETKPIPTPKNGNCPRDFYQYGSNNSLCCKGNVSEWNQENQTYMKCDAPVGSEKICKISPSNMNGVVPYCYSDTNTCEDAKQVWNVLKPEEKTAQRSNFETLNKNYNCNINLNA